jgi:hypothetical protein
LPRDLPPVDELPMAVQEIEELRLERSPGPIGIEIGEERVVGIFEHDGRVDARAEPFGERGFAGADRSFDRDMAELQSGPMISFAQ